MFNLREVEQWLGLNIVEIWVNLVSLTVFSVLLTLKLDEVVLHIETPTDINSFKSLLLSEKTPEEILYDLTNDLTWWQVFSPLFISDALNCYFCTIAWIRMYVEGANGKISRFVLRYSNHIEKVCNLLFGLIYAHKSHSLLLLAFSLIFFFCFLQEGLKIL